MKEFIGTGKTIEEATAAAKLGLNAPEQAYDNGDVKIEIVAMPKKKVLGIFGGSDAQVKASFNDEPYQKKPAKPRKPHNDKPAPKKAYDKKPYEKNADSKQPYKNEHKQPQRPEYKREYKPERPKISEETVDLDFLCGYIRTILEGLKINDAEVNAHIADNTVEVTIQCDDYGIIIGRRGETLDSIQYLASLAMKNKCGSYARVAINVGNYREKREETLRALAIKNANYVVRSGRRYSFEPMNPYERRIIHTAVQEVEGAVSRSIGSGSGRRVLIEPEGGVRNTGRRRPPYNKSNRTYSGSNEHSAPQNREKRVDRADIPKFGKIEVNKD